ncbi:hypothetical protein PUN28_015428 [Cardiocondyla obscurior]|uniref:Uncharacterized protein n=1 Tax=Cardiocondyla obscurior TaxID=286306 RepID=A0AAW2EWR8_9HYME
MQEISIQNRRIINSGYKVRKNFSKESTTEFWHGCYILPFVFEIKVILHLRETDLQTFEACKEFQKYNVIARRILDVRIGWKTVKSCIIAMSQNNHMHAFRKIVRGSFSIFLFSFYTFVSNIKSTISYNVGALKTEEGKTLLLSGEFFFSGEYTEESRQVQGLKTLIKSNSNFQNFFIYKSMFYYFFNSNFSVKFYGLPLCFFNTLEKSENIIVFRRIKRLEIK